MTTDPHPDACRCISYKADEAGRATCGPCIDGDHERCSAHHHGVPGDRCPRVRCYIKTCPTQPRYRVEAFPAGRRVNACSDHLPNAADWFTTTNQPILVIPLRHT